MYTFKIADCPPGIGKTKACIEMMNENLNQRYLFVTPYKDEIERICKECSVRDFVAPKEQKKWSPYKKLDDLHHLLRNKKNIATTHALFWNYTEETKQLIKDGGYILVLDEVVDPLIQVDKKDANLTDLDLAMRKGIFEVNDDEYSFDEKEYEQSGGVLLKNINKKLKSKILIRGESAVAFWKLSSDVFDNFKDAYLLCYMFEYQPIRQYFELCGIDYRIIGVRERFGRYEFCNFDEMDRKMDLTQKIHILDDKKLNSMGDDFYNLSLHWFSKHDGEKEKELKNNMYNYFRNKLSGTAKDRMWTSFKTLKGDIKGDGYAKEFVAFTTRATNKYSHKRHIAYGVNPFMQPWKVQYFKKHGAKPLNQDMWSLSYLLQFLFRSAIRKGEDVWVYIPSARMRELLKAWMINLKCGKDLDEIKLSNLEDKK